MTCKICGATLSPNETICRNCGASNSTVEPTVPKVEPIAQPAPVAPAEPVAPVAPAVPTEPVAPAEPAVPVTPVAPTEPVAEQPAPVEQVQTVEEPVQPAAEPQEEESVAKKDNGKFLVVIGVIVGLLATAVIGYLIYSSLKAKNEENSGSGVVITRNVNYTTTYANYKFELASNITANSGSSLKLVSDGWEANITYAKEPEYNKITSSALKKAFESVTDYKVGEFIVKNYGGVSCLEANVDYTDGVKTSLLLLKRDAGGYWYVELAKSPYTAYPEKDIAEEVISLIAKAKKAEDTKEKLNIKDINIEVEEETTKVETPTE